MTADRAAKSLEDPYSQTIIIKIILLFSTLWTLLLAAVCTLCLLDCKPVPYFPPSALNPTNIVKAF